MLPCLSCARAPLLVVFSALCSLLSHFQAAEAPPAPDAKADAAGQRPGDMGDLVDRIPCGPLEDNVVLQSGDLKIMFAAIGKVESAYVAAMKKQQPKFVLSPGHQSIIRKSIAFRFLLNAILEKHVADNKIEVAQKEFEEQFERLKKAKKDEGLSYEQFLANMGLTDDEFRSYWRANLALRRKLAELVTGEDVDKALSQQKDRAALRRVSHILFMYKGAERAPATVTRTKEEARAAAEEVLKKLKGGEDFARLAASYSDCPSKTLGGDLNYFPRKGALVEPFADAAYKLEKPGDYTPAPVETPFGCHIIKLTAVRGVEEMQKDMRERLIDQKLDQQIQQLVQEAAAKARYNAKLF